MSSREKLRDVQDRIRNQGWRIEWIPWQGPGRAEYVHNTPLTLFTGLGGAVLFFGSVYLLISGHEQGTAPAVGLSGLAMIFAGRLYAAFNKQAGWIRLTAQCIDREIRECHFPSKGNRKIVWEYRLLCTFTRNGSEYRVTPEASHTAGFRSQDLARKYLDERIGPDGTCQVWVDPGNPLHAVFDHKQRI